MILYRPPGTFAAALLLQPARQCRQGVNSPGHWGWHGRGRRPQNGADRAVRGRCARAGGGSVGAALPTGLCCERGEEAAPGSPHGGWLCWLFGFFSFSFSSLFFFSSVKLFLPQPKSFVFGFPILLPVPRGRAESTTWF